MSTFVILFLFGALACINAKPTHHIEPVKTINGTVVPEERCGGGGGGGGHGGGYRGGWGGYGGGGNGGGGGGIGGGGGAGQITGVQPLSDGSYLLYSGNQVVGRTQAQGTG